MSDIIDYYQQLKTLADKTHHRRLCCLQGTQTWCYQQAQTIIQAASDDYKWCGESPESIVQTPYAALLGQDVALLILNMQSRFDANMFAAAEGSVCGGGVIVLLLTDNMDPNDLFYHYIKQQMALQHVAIYQQGQPIPKLITPLIVATSVTEEVALSEQQQAVTAVIKTITGHRRRPLVLTANRGRGKSAALGIAAATLINQGLTSILVCAPNKQATATLFKHAAATLQHPDDLAKLTFIAPDALFLEHPTCELLLIDEAAAIPLKLLTDFTQHYSRLVFATTQFGYEGSGRGFALRFQQTLNSLAPGWRSLHLHQAIRWAANDPVEAFTLSCLCLQEKQESEQTVNVTQPQVRLIERQTLLTQPDLLNQLFSLLVNAHYQTKPSDLEALLNDDTQHIVIMQQDNRLLGVALVNREGALNNTLCEQIYLGKRRVQGHLVAQSLTFHSGFQEAGEHRYARIQRIAIQPALQHQGLGSQLVTWIIDWATQQQFDHVCASFAASDDLLRFWFTHQLQVLRIGTQKDKSSGQHSFIVNLPLTTRANTLHQHIHADFVERLSVQLPRQLKHLDTSLLLTLWPQIITPSANATLLTQLSSYVQGHQGYDNVEYLLITLVKAHSLSTLTLQQQQCVIAKIIQNQDWATLIKQHHFTGQKQAQTFFKHCICDLLTSIRQPIN